MADEQKDASGTGGPAVTSYGTARADAPRGSPEYEHLLPAFRTFAEDMRGATYVFENEDDVEGCKIALHAAIRLLGCRHLVYWRVFAEIYKAFENLQRGIDPELFSRSQKPRPRSRSGRREHAQTLAAVCLEWHMEGGKPLKQAAAAVARKVNRWDEFKDVPVTDDTVRHWRNDFSAENPETSNFHRILRELRSDADADRRVQELLDKGAPVSPAPRNTL